MVPSRSSAGWATRRYAIEASDPSLDIAKDCEQRFCKPLAAILVCSSTASMDVHRLHWRPRL